MSRNERELIKLNTPLRNIVVVFNVDGKRYKYNMKTKGAFKKEKSKELRRQIRDLCEEFIIDINEYDNTPD